MSAAPIDYDALAAKSGGSAAPVDYDSLSAQHGAIQSAPATTEQSQPRWPMTQNPGESYDDFMKRVIARGKTVTQSEVDAEEQADIKKAPKVLAASALAGPAFLMSAVAPPMAAEAVGGGAVGSAAGGATAGGTGELIKQGLTGENPVSKKGAIDLGTAMAAAGVTGGMLYGAGRLLSWAGGKASDLWDAATGYKAALQKAQQAVGEAQASYPQGQAGEWAKTNEILGVPKGTIRVSTSNPDTMYGNAGRGLEIEGLDSEKLQQMKPPDMVRAIAPRLQAAGKAVQATADQATVGGVKLDGGKSAFQVLKAIRDPGLQEKAIDILNEHTNELGIHNVRDMTPTEALQLRQALRNDASFKSPTFDSIRGIGAKLYSAVSSDLHAAVPSMTDVDTHYGDLKAALDAAQKQTANFYLGKWTPPTTRLQEAQSTMPVKSDYTNRTAIKI